MSTKESLIERVEEALNSIKTKEEAPDHPINFIIIDPDKTALNITLQMKDVKLDQLCRRLAQLSGLSVSFEEDAIVFEALKSQQTRTASAQRKLVEAKSLYYNRFPSPNGATCASLGQRPRFLVTKNPSPERAS